MQQVIDLFTNPTVFAALIGGLAVITAAYIRRGRGGE